LLIIPATDARGIATPRISNRRDDLFRSAAEYYAKFRRACPLEVVSYLVEQFRLNGQGRLLDVGCGTGQVFRVLAKYFRETIAIDAAANDNPAIAPELTVTYSVPEPTAAVLLGGIFVIWPARRRRS
jgi:SAM-dependent methyltransferase